MKMKERWNKYINFIKLNNAKDIYYLNKNMHKIKIHVAKLFSHFSWIKKMYKKLCHVYDKKFVTKRKFLFFTATSIQ